MKTHATIASALAAIVLTCGPSIRASSISAQEANIIISSAALDQDLLLPGFTQPIATGQVATLNMVVTSSGWSGPLTGNFFGNALNVNYAGNSTAFGPSGTITWNSSGTYGTDAWTGSGTAVFTSTDMSDIMGSYTSSLTIGSDTIALSSTISGSENSTSGLMLSVAGDAMLTIDSQPPVVIGTRFVIERAPNDTHYLSLVRANRRAERAGLTAFTIDDTDHILVPGPNGQSVIFVESDSSTPEPSSLVQAGIGVACLLGSLWAIQSRGRRACRQAR